MTVGEQSIQILKYNLEKSDNSEIIKIMEEMREQLEYSLKDEILSFQLRTENSKAIINELDEEKTPETYSDPFSGVNFSKLLMEGINNDPIHNFHNNQSNVKQNQLSENDSSSEKNGIDSNQENKPILSDNHDSSIDLSIHLELDSGSDGNTKQDFELESYLGNERNQLKRASINIFNQEKEMMKMIETKIMERSKNERKSPIKKENSKIDTNIPKIRQSVYRMDVNKGINNYMNGSGPGSLENDVKKNLKLEVHIYYHLNFMLPLHFNHTQNYTLFFFFF